MNKLIIGMLMRALRGVTSTGISALIASLQHNPNWMWLAPVILAAGKGLREKFPQLNWLPF